MTREEISKLLKPLVDSAPLYRDHFSLGCFLLTLGHQRSGTRVCDFAMKSAGITEPLLSEILAELEANAVAMGDLARPKEEIVTLFQSGSPGTA